MVREGIYPAKMAKLLHISASTLSRKLKWMEEKNMVRKINSKPNFYEIKKTVNVAFGSLPLTEKKSTSKKNSFFKKKTNVHDLKVKYKILRVGHIENAKKIHLKNWTKYTKVLEGNPNITLEITPRSAIADVHSVKLERDATFLNELNKLMHEVTARVTLFLNSSGYSIDNRHPEIISQHMATQTDEEIDKQVPSHTITEINLGRKARSTTGKMKQKARAWGDKSEELFEVETNDLTYQEKMLMMPETIHDVHDQMVLLQAKLALQEKTLENTVVYAKEIENHRKAINGINSSIAKLTEIMVKIERKISKDI